ncbi:MAG: AI-2E family transporter [Candidatus Woesearchaeota archaeon]
MDLNDVRKYLALILIVILAFVAYKVTQPFLMPLIIGAIFAFVFYPLYKFTGKKIKNNKLNALVITFIIFIILTVPFTIILNVIANESISFYNSTRDFLQDGRFTDDINCSENESVICNVLAFFEESLSPEIRQQIRDTISTLVQNLVRSIANIIASIPNRIIQFIVLILSVYVTLIEGNNIARSIKHFIPLSDQHKVKLSKEFTNIIDGIIYGQIFTAIIQGIIASIGFYIFGVSSPLVWGLLFTSFFALIPFLGAASIWVPMSIIKVVVGVVTNDPAGIGSGIGLALYGFFVISMIDNIIRPKLMGDKAKMNIVFSFISILGGIAAFGISGLILGPVIISLFMAVVNIYIEEVEKTTL